MAKIKKGVLGPFIGKLGPIVGSSWKNIPYIKTAPQAKGKRSYTPAQLLNQQRFKLLNNFLEPFHPFVSIGFDHLAKRQTALNLAFTINYREAMELVGEAYRVVHERVCISRGSLPSLTELSVQRTPHNEMLLNWASHNTVGKPNDQLMLVLYSPHLQLVEGFVGIAQRSDTHYLQAIPQKMAGHALEVYLSMVSLDRKKLSNSKYLGRMEP